MLEIGFAKPTLPRSGALVLLVGEGEKPGGLWAAGRRRDQRRHRPCPRRRRVQGRQGQDLHHPRPRRRPDPRRRGRPGQAGRPRTPRTLQDAGGNAVAALSRDATAAVAADALQPAQAAEVALGAVLGTYRFDRYRTKEKPEDKPRLVQPDPAARRRRGARRPPGSRSPASPTASTSRATWSASRPTC